MKKPLIITDLDEVIAFLDLLKSSPSAYAEGDWDVCQNLTHCAQSIEFAMTGYPVEKPRIFQSTIGKLVFNYFTWKGYMRHNINGQNPGEPAMTKAENSKGIECLEKAIMRFDAWDGTLHPHRFYGKLSKKQYAKANAMHIANHLELIHFE